MQTRPTQFINANLPIDWVERIKAEARHRAVMEARHIPYVHVLREALEKAFPATLKEGVQQEVLKH